MRKQNQSHLSAIQPKIATFAQKPKQPVAPPVYRPQPVPKVLQTKAASPIKAANPSRRAPVAPPVYRPQPTPKVLQRKTATKQQIYQPKSERQPLAPPVYWPQPMPKVLQGKLAGARQSAQGPRRPPQPPPVYRPQPLPKVLQTKQAGGRQSYPARPSRQPLAPSGPQLQARASNNGARPGRSTQSQVGTRAVIQRRIERLWNSAYKDIYEEAFAVFDTAAREVDSDYRAFADDPNSVIAFKEHKEGAEHPSGLETGHALGLTDHVISGKNDSDVYIQGADIVKSRSWTDHDQKFTTRRVKVEISMRLDDCKPTVTGALQTLIHEWALHGHPFAEIINVTRQQEKFEESQNYIHEHMGKLEGDKHHKHLAEDWGPQMLMQKITTAAKKYLTTNMTSKELDEATLLDMNDRRKTIGLKPLNAIPGGAEKNLPNVNLPNVDLLYVNFTDLNLTDEEKAEYEKEQNAFENFF